MAILYVKRLLMCVQKRTEIMNLSMFFKHFRISVTNQKTDFVRLLMFSSLSIQLLHLGVWHAHDLLKLNECYTFSSHCTLFFKYRMKIFLLLSHLRRKRTKKMLTNWIDLNCRFSRDIRLVLELFGKQIWCRSFDINLHIWLRYFLKVPSESHTITCTHTHTGFHAQN